MPRVVVHGVDVGRPASVNAWRLREVRMTILYIYAGLVALGVVVMALCLLTAQEGED